MIIDMASVALKFLGTPYVWGGNDIATGVDCSGFVCEVARSIGFIGAKDYNAQNLYSHFLGLGMSSEIKRNSILFFGKDEKSITHVAIAIDDQYMIEAGGEGRVSTNRGYVRIRPIINRSDLIIAIKGM
jgi:cell wall-associated NlpC family hydrolase